MGVTVACVGFLLVSHGILLLDLTCFVMTPSIMRASPARRTCKDPGLLWPPGATVWTRADRRLGSTQSTRVSDMDGRRSVWFEDSEGNVIGLIEGRVRAAAVIG